jgi:diaminopimelate epimerase
VSIFTASIILFNRKFSAVVVMRSTLKVDFVKGHMGGNEIILVQGGQIPEEHRIKAALALMESPSVRGDQVGFLEKPHEGGDVKVRIVDRTEKTYITMCGGLTQVLPRAFRETDLGKRYGIGKSFKELALETDLGTVRISVRKTRGKMTTHTDMTKFVEECYHYGVSRIRVSGVDALKVGEFLVVDVQNLREEYVAVDFREMNAEAREVLLSMQKDFDEQHLWPNPNAAYSVFEMYPEDPTHGRVVFPHNITTGHIEPSCGTGTTAIAIALAETKRTTNGFVTLRFDSGGGTFLGGPETTEVRMVVENSRVKHAEFSHSLVEITADGKAWLSALS